MRRIRARLSQDAIPRLVCGAALSVVAIGAVLLLLAPGSPPSAMAPLRPEMETRQADAPTRAGRAPDLTAMLRLALSDPEPSVRIEALDALAERGEAGLAVIREATADPSQDVAAYARHLLSWADAE